jgi:hypothetical protein
MKTIEHVAKEYANDLCESRNETLTVRSEDVHNYINDAFKEGANFAQQWIDVNDELPEFDVPVICKVKYSSGATDFSCVRRVKSKDKFSNIDWNWSSISCRTYFTLGITHWRPIELK